jgi:hypothetical protein
LVFSGLPKATTIIASVRSGAKLLLNRSRTSKFMAGIPDLKQISRAIGKLICRLSNHHVTRPVELISYDPAQQWRTRTYYERMCDRCGADIAIELEAMGLRVGKPSEDAPVESPDGRSGPIDAEVGQESPTQVISKE